jgi:hypothetical protein
MPRNRIFNDRFNYRLPKGIRKYIRKLKADVNKSSLGDKEKKEEIKKINLKFYPKFIS